MGRKNKMADETDDSKASSKVKLAKLFTSEGNLERSFTLHEIVQCTGLSSSSANVALFSLINQGVLEQTIDSPPSWTLRSTPRLSEKQNFETSTAIEVQNQPREVPSIKQEANSSDFSLEDDLQTQISFLLNSEDKAFTVDEILQSVARSTNDCDVVINCLNTLEHYGLVSRDSENPSLWCASSREYTTDHKDQSTNSSSEKIMAETKVNLAGDTHCSQAVKQESAIESLKGYTDSPQNSPNVSALESLTSYSSPQRSPNSPMVPSGQEQELFDNGKGNALSAEKEVYRDTESDNKQPTSTSQTVMPPMPSVALFQDLRRQAPNLNPISTSQCLHKELESVISRKSPTQEFRGKETGYYEQFDQEHVNRLYQQAYLTLEMGDDCHRLNDEIQYCSYSEYSDEETDWDHRAEHRADCYRDDDETQHGDQLNQTECSVAGLSEELSERPCDKSESNGGQARQAVQEKSNEQSIKVKLHNPNIGDTREHEASENQDIFGITRLESRANLQRPLTDKEFEVTAVPQRTASSSQPSTHQRSQASSNAPRRGPSAAPPPPTAALFQSLMAKCSRPPAPVVMKPAQSLSFQQSSQLRSEPTGNNQSRFSSPAGIFPSPNSLQVNRPPPQYGASRFPNQHSFDSRAHHIRQTPPVLDNSTPNIHNENRPGITRHSPTRRDTREGTHPSDRFPARTTPSSGAPVTGLLSVQSKPAQSSAVSGGSRANNFPSQQTPRNIPAAATATSSKLPPPPTASLFKNLVSRGPQALPSNARSTASKQPARLTVQESQILDYMKQEGKPCQVLQLTRIIGCRTKKEINPTLYHLQTLGLIYKMHDHPPTWKLRSSSGSYGVQPKHPSPTTPSMAARPLPPGMNPSGLDVPSSQLQPGGSKERHLSMATSQPPPLMSSTTTPFKRKWEERSVTFAHGLHDSSAPPIFKGFGHDLSESAEPPSCNPPQSVTQPPENNPPQRVTQPPAYNPPQRVTQPPAYNPPQSVTQPPSYLPTNPTPTSSSQVLNKVTFSAINKNPVSTLNEYAQKNHMEVTFELIRQGRGNRPCFEMAAKVGTRTFPSVTASTTKDARREAADLALRTILGQSAQGSGSSLSGEFKMIQAAPGGLSGVRTHFDLMAALSHHAFLQIAAAIPDKFAGRKVIACMIMKNGPDDTGHVVSLGAGNRCVTGQRLSMEGKTVNDSHAEIVSRRALLRFIYSQLNNFYLGGDSIFVPSRTSPKLCVSEGITFHLYISTAPCGDGALFTPREISSMDPSEISRKHNPTFTNKQQGIMRTKIEDGEGTIPIDPSEGPQTWDGLLQGRRLRTMSCSDKICRWNILGLQGSLLSHLIEPIYLESLTLGYLYDHGHLSRAVCCRLQNKCDLNSDVPQPYHVNHPWLGRVTAYDPPRETEKTNNLSVNWTIGDAAVEVTDGRTGACMTRTGNSPTPSRLCKASLYSLFKDVCAKAGNKHELINAETYREAKALATVFQETKQQFYHHLKKSKYGQWVCKPLEQELF